MNNSKSDDHSKCVKAIEGELKIDHDGELIENEGDHLEEFETKKSEELKDHSKCTLAWEENWGDDGEDETELDKILHGSLFFRVFPRNKIFEILQV